MEHIYAKARAKINLNLIVLNKRQDGFHNLKSVFQKISLYDELYISKTNTGKIETNIKELNNQENIVYKAYCKLKELYPTISGIKVKINKNMPMKAGLAGGSTDCASFILSMNKLFNLNLSKKEIEKICVNLGADVVPCLYNTPLIAKGIGEKIAPINSNFKYYVVIVKPKSNSNTKEMYSKIDELPRNSQEDNTSKIVEGLKTNNLKLIANNLYNTFEKVVNQKDKLKQIKKDIIEEGSLGCLLSGSGSSVFGLFESRLSAKSAFKSLRKKYNVFYTIAKAH